MGRRVGTTAAGARAVAVSATVSISDAVPMVLARWQASGALSEQTRLRMGETVVRYGGRLTAQSIASFAHATPTHARQFITAHTTKGTPPEPATCHARRTALRTLYRTLRELGLATGDPTADVHLPPRGKLAARPLTDDEVTLARISAYGHPHRWTPIRAVAWALAEATAVTSELATIRAHDLDNADRPQQVALPGTRRHDPRTGTLTPWGSAVLARRVHELRAAGAAPDALLAHTGGTPPAGPKAQAAVCNAITATLKIAGLAAEPDVRPTSVRHWAGRALYDSGARIDVVAVALGHRSLDEAADDIGLHWRQTTSDPRGAA